MTLRLPNPARLHTSRINRQVRPPHLTTTSHLKTIDNSEPSSATRYDSPFLILPLDRSIPLFPQTRDVPNLVRLEFDKSHRSNLFLFDPPVRICSILFSTTCLNTLSRITSCLFDTSIRSSTTIHLRPVPFGRQVLSVPSFPTYPAVSVHIISTNQIQPCLLHFDYSSSVCSHRHTKKRD